VYDSGELLEVTRRNSEIMTTRGVIQQVEEEIERALDRNAKQVNKENCDAIFQYKVYKTRITWVLRC